MKPRIFVSACAALCAFCLGYALPAYGKLPSLWYDPVARRFFFAARSGGIPIGYWGQAMWGTGAAAFAFAVAWLVTRRPPRDGTVALAGLWALTAVLLVGAYFTWNNWP